MVIWLRPLTGVVFLGAIALRVSERRIVEALEAAGATEADRATGLTLSNPLRRWQFHRLLAAGAVGETMDARAYLNLPAYAAYRSRRRRRALLVIPVVLLLGFIAYYRSTHPG